MKSKKSFFKKAAIFVVGILILLTILVPVSQSLTIRNEKVGNLYLNEDFTITLHRIKEEDEIDPWPHGEPDWQIRMYVKGIQQVYECTGEDIIVDQTFTWPGIITPEDETIDIKFELLDKDSGIWPDLHDIADISACVDINYQEGDYDDTTDFANHRPAVFKRTYNLQTKDWEPIDSNNDFLNVEYQQPLYWFVTSGNYDGSTTVDENDATVWFNIIIGNNPPYPPEKPNGPSFGWQGMLYEFSTKGFDIDGDLIQFGWDWNGDSEIDELTGFYDSWESVVIPHIWTQGQIYYIKVMAIDDKGAPGQWSDAHKIRVNAPGGINGVESQEWDLGHIYSVYYNHEKTQEIINILRSGGNVVAGISALITAIAAVCGVPIPFAAILAIVSAIIRLGVEIFSLLDQGMGIYVKHYVIEVLPVPYTIFSYVWSQTAEGGEGQPPAGNSEPLKPSEPEGRTIIIPNIKYTFSSIATDPDNDEVGYIFDWGDGNFDSVDLTNSGEKVSLSHAWKEKGAYEIRVKVLDKWGQESEWSESHKVKTSLPRYNSNGPLIKIIEWLQKLFNTMTLPRLLGV